MTTNGHILIINPGSSSTKSAIYKYDLTAHLLERMQAMALDHSGPAFKPGRPVLDQLEARLKTVQEFLNSSGIAPQLIMARGAPLRPLSGGVYAVDSFMLQDLRSARYADHASNLAALIGDRIAQQYNTSCYIADPITTDEFEPLARISGVPMIRRKSRSHALNIKASTRKLCQRLGKDFQQSNWVVCHMGSGISVAAVRGGRIIDVNDALLGMGPFSHDRAGALPIAGLLDLAYSGKYEREDLDQLLSANSGLKAYLGTADFKEVEDRLRSGDSETELIFEAMIYQIAKEIAAMASVFSFHIDGILLTGGMAYSNVLCEALTARVAALSQVYVEAGENELEALAQAGLRILLGKESVKTYGPAPV